MVIETMTTEEKRETTVKILWEMKAIVKELQAGNRRWLEFLQGTA